MWSLQTNSSPARVKATLSLSSSRNTKDSRHGTMLQLTAASTAASLLSGEGNQCLGKEQSYGLHQ